MKSNLLLILIFLLICGSTYAGTGIDLDSSPQGRNIKTLKHTDFKIKTAIPSVVKANLLPNSFKWLRVKNILLVPSARIEILVSNPAMGLILSYKDKTYSFQQTSKGARVELEVSLFERTPINILKNNKAFDEITWQRISKKPEIYIDDSCSRNKIEIKGITTEAITLGCKIEKVGLVGEEKPTLEVIWLSPDLKTTTNSALQYANFSDNSPVKLNALNTQSKALKELEIRAQVPKRIHRLFTAAGIGPYAFETKLETEDETQSISEPAAPALFFYTNYQLSKDQSIRGFNAAVFKESIFDNAGIYLGSDFGFSFDNRLYFTTLIGVQYLYFKFDKEADVISEPIFPQGLEFMYRHAFDIPNYIISGGFFLSTSSEVEYQNAWIRWGKKYFWELNYIGWGKDNFSAKMYGISLGFPLKGFL